MLKKTCATGGLLIATAGALLTSSPVLAQAPTWGGGGWGSQRFGYWSRAGNWNGNSSANLNRIRIRIRNNNNNVAVARSQRERERDHGHDAGATTPGAPVT